MFFGRYNPSLPFEQNYRCYSASFIDKPHLENGDKVIMPPSALDRLASLRIDYPMLFEVHSESTSRTSHCGVLEFVADEGMMIMPYWMMQNLLLQEGDVVRVKSATLPKGTYVKLQPHTKDFLDISNPKAVLETTLRNFSCLTVGDNIMVAYNNKKYYIDIVEAKPAAAISIIETDCEVDFAPPLDYKEPEKVPPQPAPEPAPQAEAEPEQPKFNAFTGVGRRLDGKPARVSEVQEAPPAPASVSPPRPAAAPAAPQRPAGKLVFGTGGPNANNINAPNANNINAKDDANGATTQKPAGEAKQEAPKEEDPSKFQAFTGRKYSLKG